MFDLEEALRGAPVVTKAGNAVLSLNYIDVAGGDKPILAYVEKIGWLSYSICGRSSTSPSLDLEICSPRVHKRHFNLDAALRGDRSVHTVSGEMVLDMVYRDRPDCEFPLTAFLEYRGWQTFTKEGKSSSGQSSIDLTMKPIKKTGWVRVYKTPYGASTGLVHKTKEEAERAVGSAIAIVPVYWEE